MQRSLLPDVGAKLHEFDEQLDFKAAWLG